MDQRFYHKVSSGEKSAQNVPNIQKMQVGYDGRETTRVLVMLIEHTSLPLLNTLIDAYIVLLLQLPINILPVLI